MPSILHSNNAIEVTAELWAPYGLRVGANTHIASDGGLTLPNLLADNTRVQNLFLGTSDVPTLLSDSTACVANVLLRGTPYQWTSATGALTTREVVAEQVQLAGTGSNTVFAVHSDAQANVLTINATGVLTTHQPLVLADTLQTPSALLLDRQRRLQNLTSITVDEGFTVGTQALTAYDNGASFGVGVGTTEPQYELDVVGRMGLRGPLYAQDQLVLDPSRRLQNLSAATIDVVHAGELQISNVAVLTADRTLQNIALAQLTDVHVRNNLRVETLRMGELGQVVLANAHLSNIATLEVGAHALVVDALGQVGIGTSVPAAALDVSSGAVRVRAGVQRADGQTVLTADGHLTHVPLAQIDRLEAATSIGVRTSNATAALDVNGDLRFRDVLRGEVPFLTAGGHLSNLASLQVAGPVTLDGWVQMDNRVVLDAHRNLSNLASLQLDGALLAASGDVLLTAQQELANIHGAHITDTLYVGTEVVTDTVHATNRLVMADHLVLDSARRLQNVASARVAGTVTVEGTTFLTGNVAIGAVATPTELLHVGGNVVVDGNLRVRGTTTYIDTEVQVTSALWVTNEGDGPAARINQTGVERILELQDDGVPVLVVEDGGFVGIGTETPASRLDVAGALSIQGVPVLDAQRVLSNVTLAAVDAGQAAHVVASRLEPFVGSLGTGLLRKVYRMPDVLTVLPDTAAAMNQLLLQSTLTDVSTERSLVLDLGSRTLHEFIGYLRVDEDGVYQFGLNSHDASDLYVNNVPVASWYGSHAARTSPHRPDGEQRALSLTAGYHRLYLRVCALTAPTVLELYWWLPSGTAFTPVPITAFYKAGGDAITASTDGSETLLLGTVQATLRDLSVQSLATQVYPPDSLTSAATTLEDGLYAVSASVNSAEAWKAFRNADQVSPNGWIVTTATTGTVVRLRLALPQSVHAQYLALARASSSALLYVRLFGEDAEGDEISLPLEGRDGFVPLATAGPVAYFKTAATAAYAAYWIDVRCEVSTSWEIVYARVLGTERPVVSVTTQDDVTSSLEPALHYGPEGRLGLRTDAPRAMLDLAGGGMVVERQTETGGGFVRWEDASEGASGTYTLETREGAFQLATAAQTLMTWSGADGSLDVGTGVGVRPSLALASVPPAALAGNTDGGYTVSANPSPIDGAVYPLFQGPSERPDLLATSVRQVDAGYVGGGGVYGGSVVTTLQNGETLRGAWIQIETPTPVLPARMEFLTRGAAVELNEAPRHVVLLGSADGANASWVRLAETDDADPRDQWATLAWTPDRGAQYRVFRWVVRAIWGNHGAVTWTRLRLYEQPAAETTALRVQGETVLEQGSLRVDTDPRPTAPTLAWYSTAYVPGSSGGFSDGRFVFLAPTSNTATVQVFDARGSRYLPPALTSNTSVQTNTLLDGTWTVSASSTTVSSQPYYAFDDNVSSVWRSSTSMYTAATGEYAGTTQTTDDRGVVYSGEWLQIELPEPIRLLYYFMRVNSKYRSPRQFYLFGSTTGVDGSFRRLDTRYVPDWNHPEFFPLDPVELTKYRFFRWVTASVGNIDPALTSAQRDSVEIVQIRLFDDQVISSPPYRFFVLTVNSTVSTARGFRGGCHDGTYGYFFPSGNEGGTPHGNLVRFRLSTLSHPEVVDLTAVDPSLKGFRGGCSDGRYVYLFPTLGKMPRVDTVSFSIPTDPASGEGILDLGTVPELANRVISAGVVLDRYLYIACEDAPVLARVELDTYDGNRISVLTLPSDVHTGGIASLCTMHGFLFVVAKGTLEGKLIRIDVRAWSQGGDPQAMDLAAMDASWCGFESGVTDGRYGYLVPFRNAGGNHGKVVRWDPLQFPAGVPDVIDVAAVTGAADAAGFTDGVCVNGRLYLLPSYRDGTSTGSTIVTLQVAPEAGGGGTLRLASEQVVLGRDAASRVAVQGTLRVTTEGKDGGVSIEMQGTESAAAALRVVHPQFHHVFDGTGRVGIRTSYPTHDLDVHGSVAADGWTLRMGRERAYRFFEDVTVTSGVGTITVGMRMQWTEVATSVQQAFRVLARCTVVGSATQHAFRRVETLVNALPGASTPGEMVMLDSSMYLASSFTGLTHRVTRVSDTSADLLFVLSSSASSFRMSIDLEIIAPLDLGRFESTLIQT